MTLRSSILRNLAAGLSLGAAIPALAHEGHGMLNQGHWHASDVWGFALVVVVAATLVWRRLK